MKQKRKKTGRRVLSFLLTLTMVVGLVPGMGLTALADATLSNLWIGNSGEITSEGVVNDTGGTGTASVAVDGNDIVITLNDFSYSGAGNSYSNFLSGITYIGDYNLRVELVGNNTITQTGNNGGNCAGFYSWKSGSSVSFCGSGSLTVSGGNAQSNSFGISVGGPLSIEECTITATSGNATQYASTGIRAGGDINVFNADVTASCGTTSGSSYCNGIQAFSSTNGGPKKLVIMSGNVKATGISSALYYANDSYRTQMILSDGHGSVLSLQAGENEAGATDVTVENVANQKYVSIKTERILHTHNFTYSATGATITATCTDDCDIADGLTLTISAPTELTYDGSAKAASLSTGYNTTAFPDEYTIKYYQGASEVEAANVKAAGDYTAKVTVDDATASVDFTIAKAETTVATAPTAGAIIYGQTLADSTLTGGEASKEGSFEWKDSTVAPAVSDSQMTEYDVVFTPTDGNYGTAECKVKLTVNKADSSVTKVPEAKALTYNGSAQVLVTAGEATGGEMQYALGTKDAATEEYSTSIPTATNAGTYYVWYKVVGDENHEDVAATAVKVTIEEKKDVDTSIETEVTKSEDAPAIKVDNLDETLAEKLLTDEEKEAYEAGTPVLVYLDEKVVDKNDVPAEDMTAIEKTIADEGYTYGVCLDLFLWKKLGNNAAVQIHDTNGNPIKITITIPDALKNAPEGYIRTYQIVRVHDGVATVLAEGTGDTLAISSDKFSSYFIAYKDVKKAADDKKQDTPATADTPKQDTPATVDTPKAEVTNTDNANKDNKISTGDKMHIGIIIMLMIDSAMAAFYLTLRKKKIK